MSAAAAPLPVTEVTRVGGDRGDGQLLRLGQTVSVPARLQRRSSRTLRSLRRAGRARQTPRPGWPHFRRLVAAPGIRREGDNLGRGMVR